MATLLTRFASLDFVRWYAAVYTVFPVRMTSFEDQQTRRALRGSTPLIDEDGFVTVTRRSKKRTQEGKASSLPTSLIELSVPVDSTGKADAISAPSVGGTLSPVTLAVATSKATVALREIERVLDENFEAITTSAPKVGAALLTDLATAAAESAVPGFGAPVVSHFVKVAFGDFGEDDVAQLPEPFARTQALAHVSPDLAEMALSRDLDSSSDESWASLTALPEAVRLGEAVEFPSAAEEPVIKVLSPEEQLKWEQREEDLRRVEAQSRRLEFNFIHQLIPEWTPSTNARSWVLSFVRRVCDLEEVDSEYSEDIRPLVLADLRNSGQTKMALGAYQLWCQRHGMGEFSRPPFEVVQRVEASLAKGRTAPEYAPLQPVVRGRRADAPTGWGKSRSKGGRRPLPTGKVFVPVDVSDDRDAYYLGKAHGKWTDDAHRPVRPPRALRQRPPPDASLAAYRAWVRAQSDVLDANLEFWSQRVVASPATATLLSPGFAGSAKAEAELRSSAAPMFVQDTRSLALARRQPMAANGVLQVCGEWIRSLEELNAHASCFKRDQPLWRALGSYFGLPPALKQEWALTHMDALIAGLRKKGLDRAGACKLGHFDPKIELQGGVLSDFCPEGFECFCGLSSRHPVLDEEEVRPLIDEYPSREYQGAAASAPVRQEEDRPRALPKLTSSGGVGTLRFDVKHEVEGLEEFVDVLKGLATATGSKGQLLSRFAVLLAQFVRAPSWIDVGLALYQFVSGIDWVWAAVAQYFEWMQSNTVRIHQSGQGALPRKEYQNDVPGKTAAGSSPEEGAVPKLEEDQTILEYCTQVVRGLWTAGVLIAMRECIGTGVSTIGLAVMDFSKTLRVTALKSIAEDLVVYVKDALKEFARRVREAIKQKSLKPLWGTTHDPVRWARHVEGMLRLHQTIVKPSVRPGDMHARALGEAVSADEIPSSLGLPVSPAGFLVVLKQYHAEGTAMRSWLAAPAVVPHGILLRSLEQRVTSVGAALRGAQPRRMPLGVYLTGASQVGKSSVANLLFKAVGNKHGLPVGAENRYTWDQAANFQDTFTAQNWCVEMDDVDQAKGQPQVGVRSFVIDWLKLVNSVPYAVESARAEEKGTVWAEPLMVTFASNFVTRKVNQFSDFPDAFWKRAHVFANVAVKPQYRKGPAVAVEGPAPEGEPFLSGELDPEKAKGHFDVWEVRVGVYEGIGKDKDECPFRLGPPMSIGEFCKLVNKRFDDHFARQSDFATSTANPYFHPCCGLPSSADCGCVENQILLQSGEEIPERLHFHEPSWWDRARQWRQKFWKAASSWLAVGLVWAWAIALWAWHALEDLRRLKRALAAFKAAVYAIPKELLVYGAAFAAALACLILVIGKTYQSRGDGVIPSNWVPVPPEYGPHLPPTRPKATWTDKEIRQAVARSMFPVKVRREGEDGGVAWLVALTPTVGVVPTHVIKPGFEGAEIDLGHGPVPWVVGEGWTMRVPANDELTFVFTRTASDAGVLPYLFPVQDLSVARFDEVVMLGQRGVSELSAPTGSFGRDPSGRIQVQARLPTQKGDCGRPYLARVGTSWWIAGFHYQLFIHGPGVSTAQGGLVTQREAEVAVKRLAGFVAVPLGYTTLQSLHCTAEGEPWLLRELRAKEVSEALTAVKQGRPNISFLGHLENGPHSATPQSRLTRTPYADLFETLERQICGASPYWGPPVFKGRMESDRWCSPLQTAFAASPLKCPPRALCVVALMDYLYGVEKLYWGEVRELSLNEAIAGVPAYWQNPVNPKTSIGLPWGGPKWKMISRNRTEVHVDPRVKAALDEAWATLERGEVPLVPGRVTLKDEPRKPGAEARVFTVIPAVWNITLKRVFGGLLAVFRANPSFFECWIGIDMTSMDMVRLVEHLRLIDPELARVVDADVSKMDKSWAAVMWAMVRMFWSVMAFWAGVNRRRVELAHASLEHVRYEWKGDLYESPQNPSGQQKVIEDNSVFMSLAARVGYYSTRPDLVAKIPWEAWLENFESNPTVPDGPYGFRSEFALANFGDDEIGSEAEGAPPLLDPERHYRLFGQVVTNGRKTADCAVGPLESATFLKRTIKMHSNVDRRVAALDKKSIIKTCVVRMPTELSNQDHAAITLTQVMREAALHDAEFYDAIRATCDVAALREGFADHEYYHSHPYETHLLRLSMGTFSVYTDILETGMSLGPVADVEGLILYETQPTANDVYFD